MARTESPGILLDQAQDKVVLLDEEGTFTYANGAVRRLLGFEPDDLVGENAFTYIHPDDVGAVRDTFVETIRATSFTEERVEYRHRTADNSWVWLESRMSNLTDSALDGYVVSSRDVSDRVRAERERDETAAYLEELAAVSGDVLWMFDGDWSQVLFVNPAYEEIYGRPIDELEDDPSLFLQTVHPDDRETVESAMQSLAAGTTVDMEYRVNPEENYSRWVWVQGQPITKDGKVIRITGFTRDITDRRRRERQLVVMDNLLRHNLRNDLNIILGEAQLIDDDVPEAIEETAVIRRTADDLLASAEKQREIIDLLTEKSSCVSVNLRTVITDAIEIVRREHPDATVKVDALDNAVVDGRPELRAAVIELLVNSIEHNDASSPRVRISSNRSGEHATIVVNDDAPPIPKVESDVLTGAHDMSSVYHSSGLGFWLVYWCVELSNGHISVRADEKDGNRVTITLPLDRSPE